MKKDVGVYDSGFCPRLNLRFDACALLAFLGREPGATVIDGLLVDKGNLCLVHAINLCEVYYDIVRHRRLFLKLLC